jgi:hypothetical protein
MNPNNEPHRYSQTFNEGGEVFSFDDSDGGYVAVQPPPETRVRASSTELLMRIVESGSFGALWVQLAEAELIRRGRRRPPSAE